MSKTVLITGPSSGFGRDIGRLMERLGLGPLARTRAVSAAG
jgi:NADP-dependent 3-hydroxy acid dehydrogenase YdfG